LVEVEDVGCGGLVFEVVCEVMGEGDGGVVGECDGVGEYFCGGE